MSGVGYVSPCQCCQPVSWYSKKKLKQTKRRYVSKWQTFGISCAMPEETVRACMSQAGVQMPMQSLPLAGAQ